MTEDEELAVMVKAAMERNEPRVKANIDPETGVITFEGGNIMDKKSLFERAVSLENEIQEAQELLKELKDEYTYNEEFNPKGLHKDDVAVVLKAAKAYAKQVALKEKAEELLAVDALIGELS